MTAVGDFHLGDFILYRKTGNDLRGIISCTMPYNYSNYILHVEYYKNSAGEMRSKYCLWVDSLIDGMFACMHTFTFDEMFKNHSLGSETVYVE